MATGRKVAIFGASGNFGAPITAALIIAGFNVTIITRPESTATFPPGIPVIRAAYALSDLTTALSGQDAVVCAIGVAGIPQQNVIFDAAEAAGAKRLVLNDFGWGPDFSGLPEFDTIRDSREESWNYAKAKAAENSEFTYTGVTIGNPIDWALRKFTLMGFDTRERSAIIYDSGTAPFTGTTLDGIGQAVVGVLQNPAMTANRFVKVRSVKTCQNHLLVALEKVTGTKWTVRRSSTMELLDSGRRKKAEGDRGWTLDLVVAQLYEEGLGRSVVAPSWEESDSPLLGVADESVDEIVKKVLGR